jgi:hypothetical protein
VIDGRVATEDRVLQLVQAFVALGQEEVKFGQENWSLRSRVRQRTFEKLDAFPVKFDAVKAFGFEDTGLQFGDR